MRFMAVRRWIGGGTLTLKAVQGNQQLIWLRFLRLLRPYFFSLAKANPIDIIMITLRHENGILLVHRFIITVPREKSASVINL